MRLYGPRWTAVREVRRCLSPKENRVIELLYDFGWQSPRGCCRNASQREPRVADQDTRDFKASAPTEAGKYTEGRMMQPFAFTFGHSHLRLHADRPRNDPPVKPVQSETPVQPPVLNYIWRLCGVRAALPFFFGVSRLEVPRPSLSAVHLPVLPETANPEYTQGSRPRSSGFR